MAGLKALPTEFGIPIGELFVASDWLLKEFNLSECGFLNSHNGTDTIREKIVPGNGARSCVPFCLRSFEVLEI